MIAETLLARLVISAQNRRPHDLKSPKLVLGNYRSANEVIHRTSMMSQATTRKALRLLQKGGIE